MALYDQELTQPTPDCFHEFDFDSSYGERICRICGVIDPHPSTNHHNRAVIL